MSDGESKDKDIPVFAGRRDFVGVQLIRVDEINLAKNQSKIAIEFSGVTVPDKVLSLRPRISGKVVSIYVDEGDFVKAGQIIAKIDDADYVSAVRALKAELDGLKAQLELAEINYERTRRLYERNAVSQADFDTAKANYENLRSRYESIKENLQRVENDLSETRVRASFSGVVVRKYVDVGAVVSPQTPMFFIQSRETYFLGKLAEEDAITIKRVIEKMSGERKVLIQFPSLGKVVQGLISSVKPSESGGFEILVELSGSIQSNVSGVGKYYIDLDKYISPSGKNLVLLPYDSLLISSDGEYVFSASDGVAVRHRVMILRSLSDYVIAELPGNITSIVSPLTQRVYDGVKIKVIGERKLPSIIQ